jgi:uncharacterized protein YndB with AHSA1/START domain
VSREMELVCRDEVVIRADPDLVYEALTDLDTYEQWNTTVEVTQLGPTRLAPGVRFRYTGRQPDGRPSMSWVIEVESLVAGRRIDLRYVEGDLIGPVAWEIEPVDDGCRTAYVYRGVHPTNDRAARSFERFGLSVHNLATVMAIEGLGRYVRGEPLGDDWRAEVSDRMVRGVAELAKRDR